MRPTAVAVLLMCGAAAWLSSCSSDSPPTAQPAAPVRLLADAAPACGQPPTHPTGLVLDSVATPPAWGIAVRDDGLTYFTESYNAGVGITRPERTV